MFEQIPGFGRKSADLPLTIASRRRDLYLSPVAIRPSRQLQWLLLGVHLGLAACLTFALLPYLGRQPVWSLVWLVGLTALAVSTCRVSNIRNSGTCLISFTEQGWRMTAQDTEQALRWAGDAVVWSWLIVLRFRTQANGKRIDLLLLSDSTSAEDRRRLRVWLRTLLWHSQD